MMAGLLRSPATYARILHRYTAPAQAEPRAIAWDARLRAGEPIEFGPGSAVRLGDLTGQLDDVSHSCAEGREIGLACRDFGQFGQVGDALRTGDGTASVAEIIGGDRLQMSRPSARNSCMNPVCRR
jgi:hypothetical protein